MLLRNTIFQLFTISQRDTSATTERWLWEYSSSWCQCWKKCFRVWIKKTPHPSKKEGQKWIVDVRYINTVLTLNVANTNQGEWTTCQKRFADMLFLNTAWRLMSRNAKITVQILNTNKNETQWIREVGRRNGGRISSEDGYTILETNWTFQKQKLISLPKKKNTLAIVEVKTALLEFGLYKILWNLKKFNCF
jgi:hypothetical protein